MEMSKASARVAGWACALAVVASPGALAVGNGAPAAGSSQAEAQAQAQAQALVQSASEHVLRGELPAARRDVDRALQLEPNLARALSTRAYLEAQAGDRAAIADARRAVALAPSDAITHLDAGAVMAKLGEHAVAIEQFGDVIRLGPDIGAAWLARANSYEKLKRHAEAIADYTHVIDGKMIPEAGELRRLRGVARYLHGDLAAAADDLRAAAAAYPNEQPARWYPQPYAFLGLVLEGQHDFAGAAQAYGQSQAIAGDPVIARRLAQMQWYTGQFAPAAASFRSQAALPDAGQYLPLWLYIVRVRADPADEAAARTELVALAPAHRPRAWTDALVELMLGKSDLPAVLAEARSAPAADRAGRQCEAHFYAAETLLMQGQDVRAGALLEAAAGGCPSTYVEAEAIAAERRLLAARAAARRSPHATP